MTPFIFQYDNTYKWRRVCASAEGELQVGAAKGSVNLHLMVVAPLDGICHVDLPRPIQLEGLPVVWVAYECAVKALHIYYTRFLPSALQ